MTKILAIDRNKVEQQNLKRILALTHPAVEVLSAFSCKDGIRLALVEDPDLILLDFVDPLSDGNMTCRKIKEDMFLKQIPVVILTDSKKMAADLIRKNQLIAEHFLIKPFDEDDMIILISSMIRMKKARNHVKKEIQELEDIVRERTKKINEELDEKKQAELELKRSYHQLEMSRLASLNLMEDFITEFEQHKIAEEYFRASESKYRELFTLFRTISDNMVDMLWAKDLDKKYIFANKAMCEKLLNAIDTDEVLGKDDLFFALRERGHHPENPSWHTFGEICADSDQVVIDTMRPSQFNEYGNLKGEFRYLEVAKSPLFDDNGVLLGTVGSARDITREKEVMQQQEESQKLIRQAQSIAGLGSYVLDIRTSRWKSSEVLDKIFGIDENYDHTTEGWAALIHPDHTQEMVDYFLVDVVGNKGRFDREYKIIRYNDKEERTVHGLGELEFDADGNVIKMFGTIQDITEQKKIQEEIKNLNNELENRVFERTAQLEEANRELEAFSYSVSHDLRAPIRAIHGFTHILIEDYMSQLDDEGRRVCKVIQENAVKMGQLVDDLLKFSQLNRTDMQLSMIDMKQLGNSVFQELIQEESRDRVRFQVESLHPAWGDHVLIRQVWTNLIANALKFSSRKEEIRISIASREEKGYVVYCIKDNGAGFDMKYRDKLFGVFQRLHSVKDFEGTGVGLAIVQRIVHRHGGKVWAEGEIDKGASFYFSLPVR